MDKVRRQYYHFLLAFMLLLYALCIALFVWTIRSAERIHAEHTSTEIYAIKRVFLKDTVQNMLRDIDRLRDDDRSHCANDIKWLKESLSGLGSANVPDTRKMIQMLLSNSGKTGKLNILFEDSATRTILVEAGSKTQTPRFNESFSLGGYTVHLGVNEDWVSADVKERTAEIIHNQKFKNGAYLWVNEIRNWNGGDKYAIRRIHPNLQGTEGDWLSTNTTDIKGNLPYLNELKGVKEHGELFQRYFFKLPNSNRIAEKLSYATAYPDFNWIVAMGIYIEDIQIYIDAVRVSSESLTIRVAGIAALVISILFLGAFFILLRMEKWYTRKARESISLESNTDPLTGALNRRVGMTALNEAFGEFRRGGESPTIFFFDLDNFKRINDNYGHDAGDIVLKAVVSEVQKNMRSTDMIFRWGGEEFMILYSGIIPAETLNIAEKLNRDIAFKPIFIGHTDEVHTCENDPVSCPYTLCTAKEMLDRSCINAIGEKILHVSISIGISKFVNLDTNPEEALKRADEAMYEAKTAGKNCAKAK